MGVVGKVAPGTRSDAQHRLHRVCSDVAAHAWEGGEEEEEEERENKMAGNNEIVRADRMQGGIHTLRVKCDWSSLNAFK